MKRSAGRTLRFFSRPREARKEFVSGVASHHAQFLKGAPFYFGCFLSRFSDVGRLTPFAAIRNRSKKGRICLQHKVSWSGKCERATHDISVFESDNAGKADDRIEREDTLHCSRRIHKTMEYAPDFG